MGLLLTVLAEFLPVLPSITIEPRTGDGAYGPTYGDPVTVQGVIDQTRKFVRDAQGQQVVSESRVFVEPDVSCPDGSRITLPDNQVTIVITVARRRNHGNTELPEHLEIACE